ncbi:class I adenylate-forming enzyme family protein [Jannaschia rubra]|uniref:class I adenylate-forming enzyme family protein n=1 Tax=Jannaschia rubra TaxID=282197 RepID=UPI002490EFAF|nr:class I adenylate-forming enzyme family protein [Jannaschia rubra]
MTDPIHTLVTDRAAEMPDTTAILDCDGREVTWAAHRDAIEAAAGLLRARGLRAGDRLAIVAENCHATAVLVFAASHLGAVSVPVNARMTGAELGRILDHATPRLVAFTTGISAEAAAHAGTFGAETLTTDFGDIALAALPVSAGGDDLPDGVAVILYTTGTTGAPKGVMLSHDNLRFAGNASANTRDMAPGDRIYGVLPLTHVFGLASMLMAASTAGAAIQFEARFRPDRLYEALMGGVTVFPAVPQMHALLMAWTRDRGIERLEGSRLRYVSSGAAPLDPAWKRKAEAFYGLALQNGYGMTESTAGSTGTRNAIGLDDVSVGSALPGTEIALDTSVGSEGDREVGEILTRGPHVMLGYYRNPEETARTVDADGWLRTGDLGRIDAEGRLHVVGRCKELIIRGGFNVYPPEVEAALNDHPEVIQSAVIGRSLPGGDEEVLAFVQCVAPETFDTAALRDFVAGRLVAYKRPTRIVAVAQLPAAPTGKLLKNRLTEVFADRLAEMERE